LEDDDRNDETKDLDSKIFKFTTRIISRITVGIRDPVVASLVLCQFECNVLVNAAFVNFSSIPGSIISKDHDKTSDGKKSTDDGKAKAAFD
jgi:hypothetical protein